NIAPAAAGGDDLIGPAGKERLDHVAAARQQAMGVPSLRYALARQVGGGKRVPLQHRDVSIELRQRAGGEQAAHAGTDHDGMLAEPRHETAPALGTPIIGAGSYGFGRQRVVRRLHAAFTKSSVTGQTRTTPCPWARARPH